MNAKEFQAILDDLDRFHEDIKDIEKTATLHDYSKLKDKK